MALGYGFIRSACSVIISPDIVAMSFPIYNITRFKLVGLVRHARFAAQVLSVFAKSTIHNVTGYLLFPLLEISMNSVLYNIIDWAFQNVTGDIVSEKLAFVDIVYSWSTVLFSGVCPIRKI